jgi:tripartite-type tricarboxylate transporter receptor subunit TctC
MKKLLIILASFFVVTTAQATWPTRPITIIVPFPPGGPNDTMVRTYLQQPLQDYLKVPVLVTNIAGANATVAANHMLDEKSGDYMFMYSDFELVVGQAFAGTQMYKKFTPITIVATTPLLIWGSSKTNNIIERFKAQIQNKSSVNLGYINGMYGWISQVTPPLEMNLVPYKGGAQLRLDVRGGHVEYGLSSAGGMWSSIYVDGTLKPVCITTAERHPAFPGIPTAKELGFKGPTSTEWYGFWARNDIDPEAKRTFLNAVRTVVAKGKIQELNKMGHVVVNYTQEETQKFIDSEIKKYEKLAAGQNRQ